MTSWYITTIWVLVFQYHSIGNYCCSSSVDTEKKTVTRLPLFLYTITLRVQLSVKVIGFSFICNNILVKRFIWSYGLRCRKTWIFIRWAWTRLRCYRWRPMSFTLTPVYHFLQSDWKEAPAPTYNFCVRMVRHLCHLSFCRLWYIYNS